MLTQCLYIKKDAKHGVLYLRIVKPRLISGSVLNGYEKSLIDNGFKI